MAETASASTSSNAEAHVVEIPVYSCTDTDTDTSLGQKCLIAHPLSEISASPGHLLLLKLYQREEDRLARRTGLEEARLDAIKRDASRLSSVFLSFHALFLTLLFVASVNPSDADDGRACKKWWLPSCLSLSTSAVLILSVQTRVREYWRVLGRLQAERGEARALARCVQELRMKGASFDLSREPPPQLLGTVKRRGRRMKSSSVEVKWRPLLWLSRNLVQICLFFLAGLLVPACKFVLCS